MRRHAGFGHHAALNNTMKTAGFGGFFVV